MTKNEDVVRQIFSARCVVCGESMYQIHHLNGNHEDDTLCNLAPLCPNCHARAQMSLTLFKLGEYAKKLEELVNRNSLDEDTERAIQTIKSELLKDKRSAQMVKFLSVKDICRSMLLKAQKYYTEHLPKSELSNATAEFPNSSNDIAPELMEMLIKSQEISEGCKKVI